MSVSSAAAPRIGSALVVRNSDDAILLGVRGKDPNRGRWVLPGGKVEAFESVIAAARRELLEETGLQAEIGDLIGVFEIIQPPTEHRVIVYHWAEPIGGELVPDDDLSDLRYVSREELAELDVTDICRRVLEHVGWLPSGSTQIPEEDRRLTAV